MFGVDSRRQCVSISLENDGILEDTEKLQVSLASGETAVMLDPKKAFVSILDTNGSMVIWYSSNLTYIASSLCSCHNWISTRDIS